MVSVVNGYVCNTSCDVEAAKKGKDPNAPPGAPPDSSGKTGQSSSFDKQPVTILDGALKDIATANAVTATSGATPSADSARPSVNLLI